MPRYHFNIRDGVDLADTVGTEMTSLEEARLASIKLASELLRQQVNMTILGKEWRLETTDANGLILFRIDVLMSETAATN